MSPLFTSSALCVGVDVPRDYRFQRQAAGKQATLPILKAGRQAGNLGYHISSLQLHSSNWYREDDVLS